MPHVCNSRTLFFSICMALLVVCALFLNSMVSKANFVADNPNECPSHTRIDVVAMSYNEQLLLATWGQGAVSVWDLSSGEQLQVLQHSDVEFIMDASFSPDNRLIATGTRLSAKVWDLQTGTALWEFPRNAPLEVETRIAFLPDNQRLMVSGYDGASVWNVENGVREQFFSGLMDSGFSQWAELSPSRRFVATSHYEQNQIYVWNTDSGELVQTFNLVGYSAKRVSFTFDDEIVLQVGEKITFWNADSSEIQRTVDIGTDPTRDWLLSHDSKYLLIWRSSGWSTWIKLWDVITNTKIHEFQRYFEPSQVMFLKSSDMVSFWSRDRHEDGEAFPIYLWDILNGIEDLVEIDLQSRLDSLNVLKHSPLRNFWLVGTEMSMVMVVQPQSGRIVHRFCRYCPVIGHGRRFYCGGTSGRLNKRAG